MSKHDHHWHGCEHSNLKFCKHCKVPYCVDCNKEWHEGFNWNTLGQCTPYYSLNGANAAQPQVTFTDNTLPSKTANTVMCKHEA